MPSHLILPLLAWGLLLAGPLLTRLGLWPWWSGLISCGVSSLLSLFLLLRLPWRPHRVSALLGALPLLPLLWFMAQALRHPLQNDVATDPYSPPPLLWAEQLRAEGDLPINQGILKAFADNPGPLYTAALPGQVIAVAETLMQARGWQTLRTPHGLQAVATSPWFGFVDDIALRIRVGQETRVDMRSASRVGQSDLGVNRARIVAFMQDLDRELARHAPGGTTTRH
ncbi:hypothetical protein G114_18606 [Aeromonas diversa CDC 2478-85]|uniref:DUF1499 domain-containing protein n=1 Tax=Aeromonas diversa CDC 2478-85 TaxID=1268237 RepID=N9VFH6_9GAMM|nr:DUF1499 domain-containing protein [Aeromonas diversa]ENY70388.1 hypothetical protein G114_18606 [Aeromonas diversa CDC 2478-85]